MALNVVTLTVSIKAAFVAGGADPASPLLTALASGLAAAIITEFQTNAVVPALGLVSPAGPVTGATLIT